MGRSTVYDRVIGSTRACGPRTNAGDADLLPHIHQPAAQRLTYSYRRIASVLHRQLRAEGLARPVTNEFIASHHGGQPPVVGAPLHRATQLRAWRRCRGDPLQPALVLGWLRVYLLERRGRVVPSHSRRDGLTILRPTLDVRDGRTDGRVELLQIVPGEEVLQVGT